MLPETTAIAEELALKNHPSVLTAMATEKAASQDLVVTKVKQNSTVAFSLSATDGKTSDSVSASITLSTSLYPTNSVTSNARKTAALHSKSMIDLREALSAAKLEARAAFREWEAVKITLNAVEAEVEASRLVQKGVSNEVKYGLKTTLDMLDAEKSFSDAELRLVKSTHDEILAEFNLLGAVGGLSLESLGIGNPLEELDDIPRPKNPL
jgi:outer membrane protein